MVSITLAVPNTIREEMQRFPEMNWSGFIRKAIIEKTKELAWQEAMLAKLKKEQAREEWAVELQHTARKGREKHFR